MMEDALDARARVVEAIAREAGALARERFLKRDNLAVSFKGPQDYITAVDGEVERIIRGRLAEAFPGDSFFGEEGGGDFGRFAWVVDPIDGTSNFARGQPRWCISIAFVADGEIALGTIYQPMTEELYLARAGRGATLNGAPIAASDAADLARTTVELGWSYRIPMPDYIAMIDRVTRTGAGFQRMGSGALGLANVADGRLDAYAELHINSWDCLAGILLVREAGGWVNDFLAGDGLRTGNPILAAAPGIAGAMRAATGIA